LFGSLRFDLKKENLPEFRLELSSIDVDGRQLDVFGFITGGVDLRGDVEEFVDVDVVVFSSLMLFGLFNDFERGFVGRLGPNLILFLNPICLFYK
jgi:hypothetical protein